MAWVERLVTRTTQPQDACGVDWNNPISRGLVAGLNPTIPTVNIAGGKFSFAANYQKNTGRLGSGLSAISIGRVIQSDISLTGDRTILVYGTPISNTTKVWVATSTGSGTGYWLGINTTLAKWSIGGLIECNSSNDLVNHSCAVATKSGSLHSIYFNGRLEKSGTNVLTDGSGLSFLSFGTTTGYEVTANRGSANIILAFNRALSDAEVKSLSENPWQIFEPEVQRVWVDDFVSAGGGVTGTLNATESGSDTGSLSGQVVTQGTLSAAELTGDTVAMAGGVIVQGALSATEAGSDTAAISGASVSTGTLNATEAGSDTASLAGVVIVQGAASASETGADTLASTGLVLVNGALSASESGSDTADINGSSVITTTGDINASESGADSAAMTGAVLVQALINAVETGGDTAQLAGQIIVTGVLGAAEVGSDTALIYSTAPVLVIAGAQTRPSRMQTGERPMQLQSSERASRLQSSTRPRR